MEPNTKFCNWIRRSSWEYRYSLLLVNNRYIKLSSKLIRYLKRIYSINIKISRSKSVIALSKYKIHQFMYVELALLRIIETLKMWRYSDSSSLQYQLQFVVYLNSSFIKMVAKNYLINLQSQLYESRYFIIMF